jgi:hypothetical protein
LPRYDRLMWHQNPLGFALKFLWHNVFRWHQNEYLPDRQFITLRDRRLATELAPCGAVIPIERTGELASAVRAAVVVEHVGDRPKVGGVIRSTYFSKFARDGHFSQLVILPLWSMSRLR